MATPATSEAGRGNLCIKCEANEPMISPTNKVLVGFSGGPASRVSLQFIHDLQYKAQQNFDACKDRSLPVFDVRVAFIDESAASAVLANEMGSSIQDIKSIVSNLPPSKEFHHVTIEKMYFGDSTNQRNKLKEIISAITDVTGKEDFLVQLRMLSLQKKINITESYLDLAHLELLPMSSQPP